MESVATHQSLAAFESADMHRDESGRPELKAITNPMPHTGSFKCAAARESAICNDVDAALRAAADPVLNE